MLLQKTRIGLTWQSSSRLVAIPVTLSRHGKQSFADQEEDQLEESEAKGKGPDYSYLLSMQVQNLIRQEKETLLENRDKKVSLCQERILEGVSYTLCVTIG